MQTELISLSKAFTENLFRIPDYQRGYSWGEKQLKEFWSDIEQLGDGENHYTGVLTLEDVPSRVYDRWDDDRWIISSKSFRPYFVVDGQQRLTTAIILVMAILERLGAGDTLNYDTADEVRKRFIYLSKDGGISRSYIFGYEKDNPSYEYLKVNIFGEESEKHSTIESTIYTNNLEFAKKFFWGKVEKYSRVDLERVYTKLTQNLLFNVFTISEGIDVHVTFETMNNRGKALSHLELLKNRLIYLSTKLTDADSHDRGILRSAINESWKTAYHYLGRGRGSFPDDFYLEVQALCYFSGKLPQTVVERRLINHRRYGEDGGDYLLEEVFTAKRVQGGAEERLTSRDLKSYAMDMKKTVEVFYKISHPGESNLTGEEKVWLERIRRLEFFDASALLVVAYKQRHSVSARLALLEQLEAMLFFRGIDAYFFAGKLIYPRRLAVELAAKKKSIAEVTEVIARACDEFRRSSELTAGLRQIGKVRNYYGWSATRFFLFEYEQYLLSQTKSGRSKLDWDEFVKEDWDTDYVTIEHIYPQKVSIPEWKQNFNGYSVAQRNSLKNSIGNLTPLSRRRNSALGNKSFAFKKGADGNKTGYAYGCYSEIEISQEEHWTPSSILDRGLRLIAFMEKRWKLDLGSKENKVKLLGIDFVLKARS